jgi:hypothetical protein
VNVPFMGLSTHQGMKPFMALAEAMGSMIAQLAPVAEPASSGSRISKVILRTRGGRDANIASPNARLLLQV